MTIYKELSKHVKYEVSRYNHLAKYKHASYLNKVWFSKQLHINKSECNLLLNGSSNISFDTYQHALGLLKQLCYQLKHHYSQPISIDSLQSNKTTSSKQSNVQIMLGHNNRLEKHYITQKHNFDSKNPKFKHTITKISQQKHNPRRFNIYLGGKYAFPVGINLIAKYFLHPKMVLSSQQIKQIKVTDTIDYAFNKVINYTVKSMRTTKEVKKKLHKYTNSTKVINAVIKKLQQGNLINDKQYAIMYVKLQLSVSNKGPQQIKLHLLRKGISSSNIAIGLSYYSNNDRLSKAVNIVHKLANRYQNSNNSFNKIINKIKANLVRKGYSFEIASNAINSAHLEPNHSHQHKLLIQKLSRAKRKYYRYQKKNPYKYRQKIMQYLYRQGFSFDTISQVLE